MSVDTTVDSSLLTRVPVETPKRSYKPSSATSSSSRSTPITASTSALYPSAVSPDAF